LQPISNQPLFDPLRKQDMIKLAILVQKIFRGWKAREMTQKVRNKKWSLWDTLMEQNEQVPIFIT
jgi:hypothetical protein